MEKKTTKWHGNDVSLSESINEYGMVYKYDGEDFNGWIADGYDNDGIPNSFAPFWMDNNCIDDYFKEDGKSIANVCGARVEEMDYEWKMDALIAYYGSYEFISGMYTPKSKEELIALIKEEGWNGNLDM